MRDIAREAPALALTACLLGSAAALSFVPRLIDHVQDQDGRARLAALRHQAASAEERLRSLGEAPEGQAPDPEEMEGRLDALGELRNQLERRKKGLGQGLVRETQALVRAQAERKRREERARRWADPKTVRVGHLNVGKGGTKKVPLFVECREGAVVILPQGTEVPRSRLGASDSAFLREARRRGYVLFLVRPSGIAMFQEARAAVEGLGLGMGWEPVDAQWKLEVEEEDGDGTA